MGGEAAFERDQRATQHGKVAIEVLVLAERLVLFKQGIADPVIADLTPSPVTANQLRKALGPLWYEGADVVANRFLTRVWSFGTCGPGQLGDDHQTAHMRQSAGAGFDGKDFGSPCFYASVAAIFCGAVKRGALAATIRSASASAVG